MNRTTFRAFTLLLWLALPLVALDYWQVWDKLPAQMATHFNAANQPNGWMTPEASLRLVLLMTAVMLTVFSALLWVASRKAVNAGSWALLGLFYAVVGMLVGVNHSILSFNLYHTPMNPGGWLLLVPAAAVVFIAVFLLSQRGPAFSQSDILAEEVHAGRWWALVFVVPFAGVLAAASRMPDLAPRAGLGLVALLLLWAAAMAWSGFRYVFTRSGVEVWSLGFRLRSIPVEQIKEYGAERWSLIGGYGIRCMGNCRAYVWCNRGVRIKTADGQVFLGHSDPDRIVHDLDIIKQFAH